MRSIFEYSKVQVLIGNLLRSWRPQVFLLILG